MVALHALGQGFTCVVLSVHERLTSHIIFTLDLGRVELEMVGATGSLMDPTAFNSLNKHFLIDLEFKDAVNVHFLVCEHGVELLGLSRVSWEAVKEDAALALWIAKVVLDEANNELIRDELATFHDAISLLSKFSACLDCVSEHVTGGKMADAKVVLDVGALGTLARAWWSNHNHVHGGALRALVAALHLSEEVIKTNVAEIHFVVWRVFV